MQEKINVNEDNFEKNEEKGFNNQTNELLANINLSDFQLHLPQFTLNLSNTSFISMHQFQPLKIDDPMKTLARKEYKNSNEENTHKLQLIPNELWLTIFWHLDTKALLQLMMVCKFLSEITNDENLRQRLGHDRWISKVSNYQPHLFFSEIKSTDTRCEFNSKLLNTVLLNANYKEFFQNEENELYQSGDNGFVIKK
ncbi:MAG: F-box protein [Tatlockia sp.]|nr:F-box protein [Tatlockia sp.]